MQNILVIKLGALGDFIQALGPMASIRKHHPESSITLLTTQSFEKLAAASGYFDRIWIDKRPKWYQCKGWLELRDRLNNGHFDRVYDLQNNDRTSFYFKLFSPKPEWVGTAKGASHRNTSPERIIGSVFDGHVQTLELAGIYDVPIDDMAWMQANLSRFALQDPYVLIVPGSAPNRLDKRWSAEKYAELCRHLTEKKYQPVLLGTESERNIIEKIIASCPQVLDLTGKTALSDLPGLGRRAVAAIGNDTGPMHMIAPTGTPCLILFSKASNPVRHAPQGKAVTCLQVQNLNDLQVETVLESLPLFRDAA